MKWKLPPDIKVYEALGAVADGRVRAEGTGAKVYSSSGNKAYEVEYEADSASIMTNDNGPYWQGYLGYPAIAYLMQEGVLAYDPAVGDLLKGIAWKDINTKFKNDFTKTIEHITAALSPEEKDAVAACVRRVQTGIAQLDLNLLGMKTPPPQGY